LLEVLLRSTSRPYIGYYVSGLDLSRWRDKSDIPYFYPADLAGSRDLAWYFLVLRGRYILFYI
jgi:hypothetical protein